MEDMQIVYLSPHELTPYENNTRKHTQRDIEAIKDSIIAAGGFRDPIGIWGKQNIIVEGHGRQIAAIEMGLEKVPCIRLDDMTDAQRREYAIKHNRTAELSEWDFGKLEEEIARLQIDGIDLSGLDFDLDGEGAAAGAVDYDAPQEEHPQLSERFVVPPFTILDSRQGYWKERKEKWRALIGDNGQARANVETYGSSITKEKYGIAVENSMSILDPVLSEIICRWYLPADGCSVFDCFAGDTVFGFVSAYLGHNFTGVRSRQTLIITLCMAWRRAIYVMMGATLRSI